VRSSADSCGRKAPQYLVPVFVPSTGTLPGGAAPMQELAHLAGHAQQFLTTLTAEQATAACALGALLLQYLSYRRGRAER
jgi:hypothetical protein